MISSLALDMVVTLDELTKVLLEKVMAKRAIASEEEAQKTAEYILDIFGYSEYVADNNVRAICPNNSGQTRDLFYMLEEENILGTYSEDITALVNKKLKDWRVFYWYFRPGWNKLNPKTEQPAPDPCLDSAKAVYDEFWSQPKIEA